MNSALTTCAPFQGVTQIIRFNWPFYAIGSLLVALAASAAMGLVLPRLIHWFVLLSTSLAAFWIVASVVVSYIVYDRSRLRQWTWLAGALGFVPRRWVNLHAGLDESTPSIRQLFPAADGQVLDIFDDQEMTEPSIRRARSLAHNAVAAQPADYRHLPIASGTCDAAILLLSAHELRRADSRARLFRELHRLLSSGGKVVLAEHLRDLPNLLAFGPGFLHFQPCAAWITAAAEAGFSLEQKFQITPFITVFTWRKAHER